MSHNEAEKEEEHPQISSCVKILFYYINKNDTRSVSVYVCDAVLPSLCTIFIVTNSKYGDTNRMSHKHFLNKKIVVVQSQTSHSHTTTFTHMCYSLFLAFLCLSKFSLTRFVVVVVVVVFYFHSFFPLLVISSLKKYKL